MPQIAYLQCPTGIAGDMFLGALVDAGVPLEYLTNQLAKLNLTDEYVLTREEVHRKGQRATKIEVNLNDHSHNHHRHLADIKHIIHQANLPDAVTQDSLTIFGQLAIAEGKVHGISPEKVHFHEVGATDALIDIIGTCIGLDYLQVKHIYCSELPTGGGMVEAAHGLLPVPVPAVLELLQTRQVPLYSNGIEKELVTPTGAAIVTALVEDFGPPPTMKLERIGLGAGNQDLAIPNILRLWLGETEESIKQERIAILETQIDDLNPQIFGYLFELLLNKGAKDVFTQPISMKKSRPGILLTIICDIDKIKDCQNIIFRETSTIGIRQQIQTRSVLAREIKIAQTKYGEVRIKIARSGSQIINIKPEYEDCLTLAKKYDVPLKDITLEAHLNFISQLNQDNKN